MTAPPSSDAIEGAPDLGRQGGDTGDGVVLDLSSCVNPYGPPPSALRALHEADRSLVHVHPYDACQVVEQHYATRFAVDPGELIATRGASEAIWQLAYTADGRHVSLPLPAYTEYLRAFAGATTVAGNAMSHDAEQLDAAAEHASMIVLSNPHNPTGRFLDRDALIEIARRHPACTFVIDESYADFLCDEQSPTLIGTELDNVAVIRSPTKFFGIGGIRVGAVWTRSAALRQSLLAQRTTWPLSMIEAHVAVEAAKDVGWQVQSRQRLSDDAAWLDRWLSSRPEGSGITVVPGPLHFRLVVGDVEPLHRTLDGRGVHVRALTPTHGVGRPALRITAPRSSDRQILGD